MSVFLNKVVQAMDEKSLVAIYLSTGQRYIGFIQDVDDDFMEISYLDNILNSPTASTIDDLKNQYGEEVASQIGLTEDEANEIDKIFCSSIIRTPMVEKIDFNAVHLINGNSTFYVEYFKNNILKTTLDIQREHEEAKKAREKATRAKKTSTVKRARVSKTNNPSGS